MRLESSRMFTGNARQIVNREEMRMNKFKVFAVFALLALFAAPARAQIATLPVVKSTAYEPSHVLKSGAGTLWGYTVSNHSSTANLYVMFFDATSVPANGTVTPLFCDAVPALTASPSNMDGQISKQALGGVAFTTGLTVALSTNAAGCGSLTLDTNNDGWFWAQVQ